MFSGSGFGSKKITLVENGEVITDDKLNAESFNGLFIDAVSSLAIEENRALLDESGDTSDPVKRAINKFGHHPSIIDIRKMFLLYQNFHLLKLMWAIWLKKSIN